MRDVTAFGISAVIGITAIVLIALGEGVVYALISVALIGSASIIGTAFGCRLRR